MPEGTYKVTATLGDNEEESNTTIKAELRRLMVENVPTKLGRPETRTFIVNVRHTKNFYRWRSAIERTRKNFGSPGVGRQADVGIRRQEPLLECARDRAD